MQMVLWVRVGRTVLMFDRSELLIAIKEDTYIYDGNTNRGSYLKSL